MQSLYDKSTNKKTAETIQSLVFFTLYYFGFTRFSLVKISRKQTLQVLIMCSVLGIMLELIQEFVIPGRHFQMSDVLFNTLGVLIIIPLNLFVKVSKL